MMMQSDSNNSHSSVQLSEHVFLFLSLPTSLAHLSTLSDR